MVDDAAARRKDGDGLELAGERGLELAEAFDLRLREREAREREARLARLAWRPRRDGDDEPGEQDSVKVAHLEARVSELNAYVRAVDESLPWRLIQWGRRLLGRAW